ncbi:hypothetical protein EDB84DRAFT_1488968 [Lactarius hengduanensis]
MSRAVLYSLYSICLTIWGQVEIDIRFLHGVWTTGLRLDLGLVLQNTNGVSLNPHVVRGISLSITSHSVSPNFPGLDRAWEKVWPCV